MLEALSMATGATGGASIVGAGLSVVGLFAGMRGQDEAKKAQEAIAAENAHLSAVVSADRIKQEQIRQDQMNFQSQNSMIQSIRNTQRARAQAIAIGANQGAMNSSGIEGALAQITGQSNEQQSTIRYNTALGSQMFDINKDILKEQNASAQKISQYNSDLSQGQSEMDFGKGFMQLGNSLTSQATPFGNVMQSMFGI